MKKQIGYYLFLAAFLVLSLCPFAGMLFTGASAARANEVLTAKPSFTNKDGTFNFNCLNDLSDYFADHFAFRQELITAEAGLEAAVFGTSASEEVLLGKEGWLYYRVTLDDYQGQNLFTERESFAAARCLSLMDEYAAQNGTQLLFTVVPNKNALYPQSMPSFAVKNTQPGNPERLGKALQAEGVAYLDLYVVLSSQEVQLYQRLDSHWNNLGAALAHDAIMTSLGIPSEPYYDPAKFTVSETHEGDLYAMLYPAGTEKDIQYLPAWEWSFTYDKPIRSAEDQTIRTSCAGKQVSLLMFRDSFGNTLYPFMAESFGTACFSRAMPYDLTTADAENADVIVIEIVQRNLRWLIERAPILPAPVREVTPPQTVTDLSFTCTCEKGSGDLFCYTGSLGSPIDPTSPIYLLCDGTVYEASPAGEGEGAFTAYLPVQSQTVQLLAMQNGKLCLSAPLTVKKGE